nr:ribonuclease H-like domain-containing protein [Tanacetum cinerariifolium]
MIGLDVTTTTTLLSDKLSLVTHHQLLTRVPVKVDLDNWNYGSWEFFFRQLCSNYYVEKYIHGSTNESGSSTLAPLTPEELKVKIVLSCIFTTLSDTFQARLVVARPKSAKKAWSLISDIVKDNKRYRTNALKAKLRSIELGDQSMESYFQKIKSVVTLLTSLDSHVNYEDVVHYARSMLFTEEMRLKSTALALPVDSSSHIVLMAESDDGSLSRYKARLVVNGSTQLEGIDVDETFSPIVKSGTIRTVLSLATSRHWPVHLFDVKNAFSHDNIIEQNPSKTGQNQAQNGKRGKAKSQPKSTKVNPDKVKATKSINSKE